MPVVRSSLPSLTDGDLGAAIAPGSGVVAVDFTADWCPPCRMMAPVLDAAAREFAGVATFTQIDSDANPRATVRFNVRGLPTLLLFKDGVLADRITGAVSLTTVRERVRAVVAG
jgi:thioredoxin 1